MRSTLRNALNWLRSFPHPSPGELLESLDGELEPARNAKVENHLARCVRCRVRLEELQEGLQFFRRTVRAITPQFPVEAGLQQLKAALGERKASTAPRENVSEEKPAPALHARLLSELTIYVGHRTAEQLLDQCNHDLLHRDRFSEIVEPVITAFLGKHAGAAVIANVLRIWDRTQQVAS